MLISRRAAKWLAVATFAFLMLTLRWTMPGRSWDYITKNIGPGRAASNPSQPHDDTTPVDHGQAVDTGLPPNDATEEANSTTSKTSALFRPGNPLPHGHNYSKVLVMAKMKNSNTDWVDEKIPDVQKAIYIADDPTADLHPPINKGHEVMIYLTYIIDTYEKLPEVVLFMHSHRRAWHNNDILNADAVQMITGLSSPRVIREGYMNLRCHWVPGCPDWIHPGNDKKNNYKAEEVEVARAWKEIFPQDDLPELLAQPCCGQFALSRERIRAVPKSRYLYYRDWLMQTDLADEISGRVWEYLWQYIFTGETSVCPDQHICYCDGYGICFESGRVFDRWFELKKKQKDLRKELKQWELRTKFIKDVLDKGIEKAEVLEVIDIPEVGKNVTIKKEMEDLDRAADALRRKAVERGKDPRIRAETAGREWHPGDGY